MELTKREQEAVSAVKKAGRKGIGFDDLRKALDVGSASTLRQRLGQLRKKGAIKSEKSGRTATYTAA